MPVLPLLLLLLLLQWHWLGVNGGLMGSKIEIVPLNGTLGLDCRNIYECSSAFETVSNMCVWEWK